VSSVPFLDFKRLLAADRSDLIETFARVLDSGRFILGQELEQFEGEFAACCDSSHGIGVGNGLDALYLVLEALGIGPGDEVVVPAHTFAATWLAVTRRGAIPVPVEPDPLTCLATADGIAAVLTPRTRAVIAVHLYGSIGGIDAIAALCRDRGVALVEDAAQAHGASLSGRRAGSFGIAGCFSFYPTKNLGALGDGGMIVSSDAELAARLRKLRNYGSSAKYVHDVSGTNSRLDELQAALLRVRLRRLDAENDRRRSVAAWYAEKLGAAYGLQLPVPGEPQSHVWHIYAVQCEFRDPLQRLLQERGVETLIHYPYPVYRQAPFAAFARSASSPSDRLAGRLLSLPMGPYLTERDVASICDAVLDVCRNLQRGPTARGHG
jgi:dTDP-3-amino-3,4,6-trideoxy-alpha-D-glucose transaminase